MENLILVDEQDEVIGSATKLEVHQKGLLHRAFSVFIFNSKGELLLQQRADDKYHSGGLWTNTCCSHPRLGEDLETAIERRLLEEMGMKCITNFQFSFVYKAAFSNGLIEHEFDHVFFGLSDEQPLPNKEEVKDHRWVNLISLEQELNHKPEKYTAWLKICFPKVLFHYLSYAKKNNIHILPSIS